MVSRFDVISNHYAATIPRPAEKQVETKWVATTLMPSMMGYPNPRCGEWRKWENGTGRISLISIEWISKKKNFDVATHQKIQKRSTRYCVNDDCKCGINAIQWWGHHVNGKRMDVTLVQRTWSNIKSMQPLTSKEDWLTKFWKLSRINEQRQENRWQRGEKTTEGINEGINHWGNSKKSRISTACGMATYQKTISGRDSKETINTGATGMMAKTDRTIPNQIRTVGEWFRRKLADSGRMMFIWVAEKAAFSKIVHLLPWGWWVLRN